MALRGDRPTRERHARRGGVAYILSKASQSPTAGVVSLTEGEAADLVAGKFYIAAMSKKSPRLSARANLAPWIR